MTLILIAPPVAEPVTIHEARAHLRIAGSMDDLLLLQLIRAARQEVERQTGLALMEQSWRLVLDDWPPGGIALLRRTPVREILSVAVYDANGEPASVAGWQADLQSSPARIHFPERPPPGPALNGIEIDFRCGHGGSGNEVPDLLRRLILMLVAHWYEFRGAVAPSGQPVAFPAGFDRLIDTFRPARLA